MDLALLATAAEFRAWLEAAGIVVGIIAAVLTGMSALGGGIWWLSAMFGRVCTISRGVEGLREEIKEDRIERKQDREAIWRKLDAHETRLDDHSEQLAGLRGGGK